MRKLELYLRLVWVDHVEFEVLTGQNSRTYADLFRRERAAFLLC